MSVLSTNLPPPANDTDAGLRPAVSNSSNELVIGLIGYAGAGCSLIADKIEASLHEAGYEVKRVKLSGLIASYYPERDLSVPTSGIERGKVKLQRATTLQDLGDKIREEHGGHAVASLAVSQIRDLRGSRQIGKERIAFVLDSLKHEDEVTLLREVYETSFRLIAVHCERPERLRRLHGDLKSDAKYKGTDKDAVEVYMERDERDIVNARGQHVRDAFYLADYFLDNNENNTHAARLTGDIDRFVRLLLGSGLIRPKQEEVGMYHAFAASLQSACLSRQVGAALQSENGEIVSIGSNEVPKFGGGTYREGMTPDNRCFAWKWRGPNGFEFNGCHNSRRKKLLLNSIADWLGKRLSRPLAEALYPEDRGSLAVSTGQRDATAEKIASFFKEQSDEVAKMPGIGDLIEYSRSIHAEMDAVLSAARSGASTLRASLYCTTFPCHNCARHLVTAGIKAVYYIEPYVKSLAVELHADSIQTVLPSLHSGGGREKADKMVVVPFTGVGPRMYEDYFVKKIDLKERDGSFQSPVGKRPTYSVRINELQHVEESAAKLVDRVR